MNTSRWVQGRGDKTGLRIPHPHSPCEPSHPFDAPLPSPPGSRAQLEGRLQSKVAVEPGLVTGLRTRTNRLTAQPPGLTAFNATPAATACHCRPPRPHACSSVPSPLRPHARQRQNLTPPGPHYPPPPLPSAPSEHTHSLHSAQSFHTSTHKAFTQARTHTQCT